MEDRRKKTGCPLTYEPCNNNNMRGVLEKNSRAACEVVVIATEAEMANFVMSGNSRHGKNIYLEMAYFHTYTKRDYQKCKYY